MKIAILGNYPPKSCGIATFTHSLARAVLSNLETERIADFAEVIAIEDPGQHHHYPEEVSMILPKEERDAYRRLAETLNHGGYDLLVVQHEYGIFGGDDGAYLLDLLDRLNLPVVTTCHTVLREPSAGQLRVMRQLCAYSDLVVVMSKMARRFLRDVFGCPTGKVRVIEHGVPEIETASRSELRAALGWTDRQVLLTFGLLGPGKGIETAIRALPAIVEQHPEARYVLMGRTHPNVVREQGESYREGLWELARELGVADHVEMIDEFVSEQRLMEALRATDLYVIPYPNEAQITSGTLAYAVGAGAVVVSTPFWHANELLAEGRGRLFPFHDSAALATTATELLADQSARRAIHERALTYGQRLSWPAIGAEYLEAFAVARQHQQATLRPDLELPPLRHDHLFRMSDDCGLIQHAKYAVPNRHEGYCLDDVGRGLLYCSMVGTEGAVSATEQQRLVSLADTYLAYIFHAQHPDGRFRNFMGYNRTFLEEEGSDDSHARALWGLGHCVGQPPRPDQGALAEECFIRGVGFLDGFSSPRALAYGILGLVAYLGRKPDGNLRDLLDRSVNRLVDHYRSNRHDGWDWFEAYLTYDNAILPLALHASLEVLQRPEIRAVAEATTRFLTARTLGGRYLRPVGCLQPYTSNAECPVFDQQPLEAMAQVLLYLAVYRNSGQDKDLSLARRSFGWFLGANDLGLPLYAPETAGCYDGLTAYGPNRNQGAESLLAYLISRVAIGAFPAPPVRREPRRTALRQLLNGYAPAWVKQPAGSPLRPVSQLTPSVADLRYDLPDAGSAPQQPSPAHHLLATNTRPY